MNEILKFTAQKIKPCPSTLIITPTQTILRLTREELSKKNQKLTQLQLIADCIPFHTSEKISVLGPVVGRSAINLALAPLLENQIKNVILLSIAGTNKLEIGQIVQATECITESGNSYLLKTEIENIKETKVLTVDNPYVETADFNSCDIIDMEISEIARLCLGKSISFINLFCISDKWANDNWQKGFSNLEFKNQLNKVIEIGVLIALEKAATD